MEYPAAYKEVVAVGASSVDGTLSELTNEGEELEFYLIDYEYACKIYDDFNELYYEGDSCEEICEEIENEETADDYTKEVEGRCVKISCND